jgi:GNAT superfamily N-acetyltransferase
MPRGAFPCNGGDARLTGRLVAVPALSILPISDDDLSFVRAMLHEAALWRDDCDAPPIEEVLSRSGLGVYVDGWGRPGDAGLIARVGDAAVGAVWVRRFRDDDHGYGYIDELTPELSIAVVKDHRGCGIGRCLMTATLVQLRLDAVELVSLSVEDDNPARSLYDSLGFLPREAADGATTMTRTLS